MARLPESESQGTSRERGEGRDRRPYYEFQYHSSDIRSGVRYLFLTRRQGLSLVVAAAVWLLVVGTGLMLAPTVIDNVLATREHESLLEERAREGSELKDLVQQLASLESQGDDVRLEMSKIYLAYGFSKGGAQGKGGYPQKPEDVSDKVPDSIHAEWIRKGNGLVARIKDQLGVLEVFLGEVRSFEEAHRDQVRNTPSISPLKSGEFVLTSPFGKRTSPFTKEIDFHPGIDLAAPVGTEIYAPADGVVVFAGRYPLRRDVSWWRYGNLVALRNGDRFITLYGHCEDVLVRSNQRVRQGEVIATVGNTGWSTNPHLHYEVRRLDDDGEFRPIDPRIYILDYRWRDEERVLIQARQSPSVDSYEPLPRVIRR